MEKYFAIVAGLAMFSFVFCLALIKKVFFDKKEEAPEKTPVEDSEKEGDIIEEMLRTPSPYCIRITNDYDEPKTCTLFGLGEYLMTKNFGSTEGLKVESECSNISYLFMLIQSALKPFETSLMVIRSKNKSQISNIITISSKDACGQMCQIPLITESYVSPLNEPQGDTYSVEIPHRLRVDFSTDLRFTVLPKTQLSFILYPESKIDITRLLNGDKMKINYKNPKDEGTN